MTIFTALTKTEQTITLARFQIIRPYLEEECTLKIIASQHPISYRTLQRWAKRYQVEGIAGLVRKRRHDKGQRRIEPDLVQFIEGIALQKTKPSAASIYRQVQNVAQQQGWQMPSYSSVHDIVHSLDPALVMLAHEGTKAYRQSYDLLYRREATRPNEIWQADHCLLDIWLLDARGKSARPWLTIIEDDYSRAVAGYFLTFDHPNTQVTSLALRQAIWRKSEPNWRICGIPDVFYTDNGADFTSRHLEQVSADLKMQLVFSIPGMPRGRGRVERFFRSVNQLFLHLLPGFGSEGKPMTTPSLTLPDFDTQFKSFVLNQYHTRLQTSMDITPIARWEIEQFLPRLPESLERLDLLLLTVATTRKVRRDGIHFQRLRYMDTVLASYIGEEVVIRYDPRDLAEIRIFFKNTFLCRAVCQEIANLTVSLSDIIRARNQRRRALRGTIKERTELVTRYLAVHDEPVPQDTDENVLALPILPLSRLKRYQNE